jgi:putative salt-induced outer membrane protein
MRLMAAALCALLLAVPAGAAAQQTLVLSNGDQLTGALTSIADGEWVFEYAGEDLTIAAADVVSFTAPEPVGFRLADGTLLAATVTTVPGGLRLLAADGTSQTVAVTDLAAAGDPSDLDALRPVHVRLLSPFFKFWRVTTSLGLTFKDGNTNTRSGTFYVDMVRATALDRLTLTAQLSQDHDRVDSDGDGQLDSLVQTAGKYLAGLRYDIFPIPKLFVFGNTRQSRDRFKEIDLRSFYTAGVGYQFFQRDNLDLRSSLGAGVRYEKFFLQQGTVDSSTTVPTGSLDGALRVALGPFDYDLRTVYSPALEDIDDFQVVTLTGLTATLVAGLGFRIQLLWEFDNTPTAGSEKNDTEFTTALTYTLGQ